MADDRQIGIGALGDLRLEVEIELFLIVVVVHNTELKGRKVRHFSAHFTQPTHARRETLPDAYVRSANEGKTAPNKPAKITSTDKDNPFQAIMMPVQVKS